MEQKIIIKKNTYYDSVSLMNLTEKAKLLPDIKDAVVAMGTETNIQLLKGIGFTDSRLDESGP
ncbi:MAG: FdrA family protein, partial [Bacteroidetes bacterium]|nr:FdrA family protein [Bacteroidota bacterium]